MVKKLAIALVVLIAAVLIYAASKPDVFTVERSIEIHAAPDKVFAQIDDFHAWAAWSPYEHLDPAMKKTFSGAPVGLGSIYEWNGDGGAGSGRMEIVKSVPASLVSIRLDMLKPFEGHNVAEFKLTPQGASSTTVKWSMSGPTIYMGKLMSVFVNVDKLVGNQFEEGLSKLKELAEK
jgi:uncharacterized protein YndB with AHSA1/START domain